MMGLAGRRSPVAGRRSPVARRSSGRTTDFLRSAKLTDRNAERKDGSLSPVHGVGCGTDGDRFMTSDAGSAR
jgi:hypothetical protein